MEQLPREGLNDIELCYNPGSSDFTQAEDKVRRVCAGDSIDTILQCTGHAMTMKIRGGAKMSEEDVDVGGERKKMGAVGLKRKGLQEVAVVDAPEPQSDRDRIVIGDVSEQAGHPRKRREKTSEKGKGSGIQ